jgi:ribokinase
MMGGVFVAGSINMDVVATASRHPKIGETVAGSSVLYFPGGKGANQAVAAAKLGAPTTLIGRLGEDAFGADLKRFLAAQGIDLRYLRETAEAHSGTAIITVANADNTIIVIPGANGLVGPNDVATVPLTADDVAVSQFEIPQAAIRAFFTRARAAGATTILNPAPMLAFEHDLLDLVDVLILNETELGVLTDTDLHGTDHLQRFIDAARLLPTAGRVICVTLGKRGAIALLSGEPFLIPGRAARAVDTTGAGDCFVGAVAAALAAGTDMKNALGEANVAASICVQRMGAAPSMPTAAEVEEALSE